MFSLIITIISIALVAVLALATLYYGGDAFNKGSASAKAAQLINEGQQIAGALQLAEQDQVATDAASMIAIDTSAELVSAKYLQAVPAGYTGISADTFDFVGAGRVFESNTVSAKVCQEVNKKAGFKAADTASTTDTEDALVVSATEAVSKVYGCDSAALKVSYKF